MELSKNKNDSFPTLLLKGISQIMLQENSWTGMVFLLGVTIGSWQMGLAMLLATTVGTITAHIFKFDKEATNQGIFGFSAALVGVALLT